LEAWGSSAATGSLSRKPYPALSGVYYANDGGSYRIREAGSDIWWLGKSSDNGASWTNVFKGTRNGNTITGKWIDLNPGATGAGVLTLRVTKNFQLVRINAVGSGFGGTRWLRLGCDPDNSVPID
jgi:hypothetical protein